MSRRNPTPRPRMANEAYYTPPFATHRLLTALPLFALRHHEAWECAAGAGHVARELAKAFGRVIATDLHPAAEQVHPVVPLDFLATRGLSGRHPLAIITNPPYGHQNTLAIAFLRHALDIAAARGGLVALLLPFEFDAPKSRTDLVGEHAAFAAKLTIGTRLRWVNLPQSENAPMSYHSWFVWSFEAKVRRALQAQGALRTL